MLLIIDNNENISKYFTCEYEFINAENYSLVEILKEITQHTKIEKIYFPIELQFKNKQRQHIQGLELLKHIRLTKELGSFQYAPILLGYTYPLEALLRNPESTILCSPATYLFHLKNIYQVNISKFFYSEEILTKETLKPYILYTDADEAKSEHDRRNEQGPLKLENELNGTLKGSIDLDLWQKKIKFLQPETKNNKIEKNVLDLEYKKAIKGKRILYIDDEADKWLSVLGKVFVGAAIDVKSDYKIISEYFNTLLNKHEEKIKEFTLLDKQAQEEYRNDKNGKDFKVAEKSIINLQSALYGLFHYDVVLLDMRLQGDEDKDRQVAESSGYLLLKLIKKINPFIPVVIFTASNKIKSYSVSQENGADGFWIKNVSSANDLKRIIFKILTHELPDGRNNKYLRKFYYKLELTKAKSQIFAYNDYADGSFKTIPISSYYRTLIYESYPAFISLINRLISGEQTKRDVAVLWKVTGFTIELRVPIIFKQKYEGILKEIYQNLKDGSEEKSYR